MFLTISGSLIFFFPKILSHLNLIGNNIHKCASLLKVLIRFDSLGVPRIFFFNLHQNGALLANCEVRFEVINYSFETECVICVIYCCEYFFFSQEVESYNYQFLYFNITMHNVFVLEFLEDQGHKKLVPV